MIRMAATHGDFAMVLRKGDDTSGTILLQTQFRGHNFMLYERITDFEGQMKWQPIVLPNLGDEHSISDYLQKRMKSDPDLWVIELNVADGERLNRYFTV